MAVAEVIGTGAVPDSDFTAPALSSRPQSAAPLALTGTSGMTWAEIHGKGDGDNLAVSIAGMTAVEIAAQFGSPPVDGYASGARVNGAYRGIPGFAQCQGTCTVGTAGSDAGKLVGNWIFLPSFPNQGYVRNEDGSYARRRTMPSTALAGLGSSQWQRPSAQSLHWRNVRGFEPGDLSARAADAENHDGDVARYEGRAAGMSLTREADAGGMTVPAA